MATMFFSNASIGAPVLTGLNGTLCAVLDWALPQNGWAIEYTATNARVYRAGVGRRLRLFVHHDSAVSPASNLAVVRGCEGATSASIAGLVDPFPTVAQSTASQSLWITASNNNPSVHDYRLVVGVDFVIYMVRDGSDQWETHYFGDVPTSDATDTWNVVCTVRGTSTISFASGILSLPGNNIPLASTGLFWARSIDGVTKSARGWLNNPYGGSMGAFTSFPPARQGFGNRIVREKIPISCAGGSTAIVAALTIAKRGWLPNIWAPIHSGHGGISSVDTHTDTVYNPSAIFRVLRLTTGGCSILEESDTWSAPVG